MRIEHRLAVCMLVTLSACGTQEDTTPTSELSERTPAVGAQLQSAIATATASLDGVRIINADSEPGNWLAHGRTYDEQRYSPLQDVKTEAVADMELA